MTFLSFLGVLLKADFFMLLIADFMGVRTSDGNYLSKGLYKFILVEKPYMVDKFVSIGHNFSADPTSELG